MNTLNELFDKKRIEINLINPTKRDIDKLKRLSIHNKELKNTLDFIEMVYNRIEMNKSICYK